VTRPLVIQTEDLDAEPAAWLAERCELVRRSPDEHGFEDLLARASGLLVRTYTRVNDAMLAKAPGLKVVARAGVGLENIDLAACRARAIQVVYTPGANTRAVVELVLALMLDALRPRLTLSAPMPKDKWEALRREFLAPRELNEITLGIYGLGRIGSQVARAAAGLSIRAIYHDLREIPEPERHGALPVPREVLLREADVLTLHVDGRPENTGLIDAAALALARPRLVLINTSRGFVVDPRALAEFLTSHPGAQALLDVHEPEPFGAGYPLLNIPGARLYPHLASGTATAKRNMSWVVRDVWRVLSGEAPESPAPVPPLAGGPGA
jgi:phosphoglycerate dehydrogenase-like enzyme